MKKIISAFFAICFMMIPCYCFAMNEPIEPTGEELITACNMIAKTIYGEARGESKTEQAAVAWCILNRVDNKRFENSIPAVITAKHQFTGYRKSNPVKQEMFDLAFDVIMRWKNEKMNGVSEEESGRVLQKDYLYFSGYKGSNRFRKSYRSNKYWKWDFESPYVEK